MACLPDDAQGPNRTDWPELRIKVNPVDATLPPGSNDNRHARVFDNLDANHHRRLDASRRLDWHMHECLNTCVFIFIMP
jgi:hypothetical protein